MSELEEIRKRVDAFGRFAAKAGTYHKTQELLDLEVALAEIERLRAAAERMFNYLCIHRIVKEI